MASANPLKIYLCDLTHNTKLLVSDTIPINVGFIATYLKKRFGNDVEISLYKLPEKIIEALKTSPPDVIAMSNYSWNSQLSEHIAGLAKRFNSNVVTAQGGPNFPHETDLQKAFMRTRPHTDFYIELEAEVSFSELIARVLAARDGGTPLYSTPLPGCVYLVPDSQRSPDPVFVKGELLNRLKNLDDIPSPYLTGILDPFFDGMFTPFIETNRGCPFKCTFCHTGNDYFNKINMFSIERIVEEIELIGHRAAALGIVNLHIADTNFGMYTRDKEIAEALYKAQVKYGWPRQILATTGKNNKERVIGITEIMGDTFPVTMAVQSMDSHVLANINRNNIKLDHYAAITKHLNQHGRVTRGEVILGLPGETKESFMRGIREIMSAGVSSMVVYSLMLLHGTKFQNPEYRKQYEIEGKFRIVPLNFGEYEGTRVFDYEEVGIANKDMPFEDYLWLRGLALMVETLYNDRTFRMLFRYARELGIQSDDLIFDLYDRHDQAPDKIKEVVKGFMDETASELWDSEEELVRHYRRDENYERLFQGEVGGNLIYKYKSLNVGFCSHLWAEHIGEFLKEVGVKKYEYPAQRDRVIREIDLLIEFEKKRLTNCLDSDADTSPMMMESPYDILAWLESDEQTPLSEFASPNPITFAFEYNELQLRERRDLFKRYGTSISALSKIMTRVGNVQSLFRTVRVLTAAEKSLSSV